MTPLEQYQWNELRNFTKSLKLLPENIMDNFCDDKKDILKCLGLIAEDIIDAPNLLPKQKKDLIIGELYEIMRKLSDWSESDKGE